MKTSAKLVKSVLSIFPPTFPTKLYHFASHFPPLKILANAAIRGCIPEKISIDEGELLMNRRDVTVCGALSMGMFEMRELESFRNSLKPGMNVVDIGANIGLYTVIAAKKVGENGKVFAFEPERENNSLLRKNVEINSFKNVFVSDIALSDSAGERELYLSQDNK